MTDMPVTLATSGVLGLIYIVLTGLVMRGRATTKTKLGDGADRPEGKPLHVAVRSHANFAEYVPLALILLGGIEHAGAAHRLVLGLAVALVIGRIAHPIGMFRPAPNPFRAGGAVLTWLVIIIASITALTFVF